ncbi:Phosphatidylinositol glycan anchor biosynthesis class O [Carabus blaptoides fortunei]
MAKHWSYFMFILWICYLIVSGILMFTRGFLLRREAFNNTSTCTPYSKIPCTPAGSTSVNITNGHEYHCTQVDKLLPLLQDVNSASNICFPQKAKVILLVVDALRYDFATYDPDLENASAFQNKLPVLRDLLKMKDKARLYKFIADPPTTTMQRLKALTTGGLPTFIDAGSNFATPEINEDNIIDQLIQHNKHVVFMGDDTWSNLYPNRFIRSWPFPSFNVWDLDTVDNGVTNQLYSEISKSDWSLLVAHFLGVDHCGHRYGPYHSEMERKLTEMNDAIKKVIDTIDDETMVFVIGDHGMTNTGDHGGDSELEVTSTLFIYSPTPLVSFESDLYIESVKQVDLIPTLASILGIPVPFSNLGALILDAYPTVNSTKSILSTWQSALLALWSNVQQTTNYINKYSETSNQFSAEKLEVLRAKYSVISVKVNNINTESQFRSFVQDAREYLALARETCEEVWIQFDSYSMSRGLLIVFLTIFFVYTIIDGIPTEKLTSVLLTSFVWCSLIMVSVAIAFSFVCYYFSAVESFELTLFFSTGMISVFMLAVLVIQNWETIAIHWYECTKIRRWLDVACRVVLLLFVCVVFTNSYILEEASVLAYLLLAAVIFIIYNTLTHVSAKVRTNDKITLNYIKPRLGSLKTKLIIMGLLVGGFIRFSMQYWRCREEQKWCINYSMGTDDMKMASDAGKIQCVVTLVFLALLVTMTRIWLRSCGNLVGFSASVTLVRYSPTVMVVCTAGFWVLHRLPKDTKSKLIATWQVDILAWTVYGLVALCLLSIIVQPLCVYVLPKRKETMSVYGQENIIPQLFNKVKGMYEGKKQEDTDVGSRNIPVVYGLGTVYSAVFVIVSILICLLVALLLGEGLAPSSVIMYFTATVVLAIVSIAQYERACNISQLLEVPSSSVLCWVLLSHYFFYGTGHQPAFPSIQWEAAFVGTSGNFNYNIIPTLLIGINTFGSYILMGVTLPLLLIGPFTLYIMFPNLASSKAEEKDLNRGELLMFACMLAVTIHCRHLMVWSIFAPKLIFEGLAVLVSLGSVIVGYLLLIRVNSCVDRLVVRLEKQNR